MYLNAYEFQVSSVTLGTSAQANPVSSVTPGTSAQANPVSSITPGTSTQANPVSSVTPGTSAQANPASTDRPKQQKVVAQLIAHHSTFLDPDKIEGIAYYNVAGVENMTLRGDNPATMSIYSLLTGDPHMISSEVGFIEPSITSFAVQPNGVHYILDRDEFEILVSNWPLGLSDPAFRLDTKKETSSIICCTPNYYFYCFKQDGCLRIACMSTVRMPPKFEWSTNTGIDKLRAMNAMENEQGITILVSKAVAYGQKAQPQEVALKALNTSGCIWAMTYQQLESGSKQFDLRSIDNDGQNFFVMNSRTRSVQIISRTGQILNKVLKNLNKPVCLSINREAKKMAIVENNKNVKLYRLTYV